MIVRLRRGYSLLVIGSEKMELKNRRPPAARESALGRMAESPGAQALRPEAMARWEAALCRRGQRLATPVPGFGPGVRLPLVSRPAVAARVSAPSFDPEVCRLFRPADTG